MSDQLDNAISAYQGVVLANVAAEDQTAVKRKAMRAALAVAACPPVPREDDDGYIIAAKERGIAARRLGRALRAEADVRRLRALVSSRPVPLPAEGFGDREAMLNAEIAADEKKLRAAAARLIRAVERRLLAGGTDELDNAREALRAVLSSSPPVSRTEEKPE